MSNHSTLEAATQDRKARLAQLKTLKRKQPQSSEVDRSNEGDNDAQLPSSNKRKSPSRSPSPSVTNAYLSGRNYDVATRGPKLGYENAPTEGQATVEEQAKQLADTMRKQAEDEGAADKPLDLFKLQPKKPNWDLKRDLNKKLEMLNVKTDNAIARIVRERTEKAQKEAKAASQGNKNGDDGEAIGMEGSTLVEAMRGMEREQAEEEKRDKVQDD